MHSYRHTQRGTLFVTVYGLIAVGIAVLFARYGASTPLIPSMAIVLLAVAAAIFCCLTVSVSHETITLRFGVSPIRKRFQVRDILTVGVVRNRWYYFWGVRYTPHGWLYTVSGLDAVEIGLRNGRKYRIGTDDPARLRAAIQEEIERTVTSPSSLNLGL
jgi:hypothetical protein